MLFPTIAAYLVLFHLGFWQELLVSAKDSGDSGLSV